MKVATDEGILRSSILEMLQLTVAYDTQQENSRDISKIAVRGSRAGV